MWIPWWAIASPEFGGQKNWRARGIVNRKIGIGMFPPESLFARQMKWMWASHNLSLQTHTLRWSEMGCDDDGPQFIFAESSFSTGSGDVEVRGTWDMNVNSKSKFPHCHVPFSHSFTDGVTRGRRLWFRDWKEDSQRQATLTMGLRK